MRWIIQNNLFIENKRQALINTVRRMNVDHVLVNVLPGGVLDVDIEDNKTPTVVNGSVMLTRIAQERGWTPGGFWSDDFTYEKWGVPGSPWAHLLLNKDAVMGKLSEMDCVQERVFVRPVSDTKSFNGQVMTREQLVLFQQESMAGVPQRPAPDTPVLVSPVKKIGQEHRHYIVEGQVITSSRYKLAGQPNFKEGADGVVLDVVRHAIALWQPARAFVLDTYISGNDIGIIETGCIGNAGLYEANLPKLVDAIECLDEPTHTPQGCKISRLQISVAGETNEI